MFALLALIACQRPSTPPAATAQAEETDSLEGGAISTAPVKIEPARAALASPPERPAPSPDAKLAWAPMTLAAGKAWLGCELDYAVKGDGEALDDFERKPLTSALQACAERGVLRLRYQGRIDADFATMVERVTLIANELGIGKRVLDVDSAGGLVEDAIRVGDFIAGSRWTIWVREGSHCHSACVFVLSAGDVRRIAGRVGIHRIIRMSSTAKTRAELNAELRVVYQRVRDFLERNGAALAVADLMMAVPNRNLRLLTKDELLLYGLDGVNPAQDDLDRLRLLRECGADFVGRRDAFARAFDRRCRNTMAELDDLNACGLSLRKQFGFPDATCPAESPLSEFDLVQAEPSVDAATAAALGDPNAGSVPGP